MAEDGFLIKFDGKEIARCYAIALDYDEWQYQINNKETKDLPAGVKTISVEVERS